MKWSFRKRDQDVCYDQWLVTRKRDRETGLDTLDYNLLNTRQLTIEEIPITTINVALKCDKSKTPWCDCSKASASEKGKRPKLPRDGDVIIPKVPRNVKCWPKFTCNSHTRGGSDSQICKVCN